MNGVLFDSIARIARHEAGARAIASVGTVVDLFAANGSQTDHAVTVELRDTGLVLPRVPIAVGALGFAAIPAIGDLVIVVFLEGDFNAPIVVGRLYHPDQNPPKHAEDEIVLRLPSGAAQPDLHLAIDGSKPSLELRLPGDTLIEIREEKVSLQVGPASAPLKVSIEGAGGGRVEIAAGAAKIIFKKDGDITLSTPGKLKLEGSEVEISSAGTVKVQGALVQVN